MEQPQRFPWEHDAYNNNYKDMGCTGYEGWNAHRVERREVLPAWRAQLGPRGMYKAGLAKMPDGRLLASPVNMLAEEVHTPFPTGSSDLTWPVEMHESTDGGRSWNRFEHDLLVGKEGSLHCLDSGLLLFTSESLDGVCLSEDGGRQWRAISFDAQRRDEHEIVATIRSPIFHADGTISFMRCVGTPEGAAPPGYRSAPCRAWLVHSTDGGRTWDQQTPVEIPWKDPFPFFIEADFERLSDGRILACSRFEWNHEMAGKPLPYPPGTMPNDHAAGHMVLMESRDEGRSWSVPREFLQYSEVQGQLTLLSNGLLLCTYTLYHLPFGVAAVISRDQGRTWEHENAFQLAWSNGGCTGWATTRELEDGALVTIHALEPYDVEPNESGRTVCHTVRWEGGW